MTPIAFRQMLEELDPRAAAEHSTLNHHVNGMNYLCLHRSERMTVKIYFIDAVLVSRKPGDYLVTPHTHRYAFESTVLAGEIEHVRLAENTCDEGDPYERFIYLPENRNRIEAGSLHLVETERETHTAGSTYWNDTRDIHTLAVSSRPTLLGLVQFSDTVRNSVVYLKPGAEMKYPKAYTPSTTQAEYLRRLALEQMDSNA